MLDPIRSEALRYLRQHPNQLFALLDAASDPRVLELLDRYPETRRSLYDGDRAALLGDVAPYLVQIPPGSALLEALVREGWGRAWGVYLFSNAPPEIVRDHLRRFLRIGTEAGDSLYFRFHDPRVLRAFLPACTPAEVGEFFGPIDHFVVEARPATTAWVYGREYSGLTQGTIGESASTERPSPAPRRAPIGAGG